MHFHIKQKYFSASLLKGGLTKPTRESPHTPLSFLCCSICLEIGDHRQVYYAPLVTHQPEAWRVWDLLTRNITAPRPPCSWPKETSSAVETNVLTGHPLLLFLLGIMAAAMRAALLPSARPPLLSLLLRHCKGACEEGTIPERSACVNSANHLQWIAALYHRAISFHAKRSLRAVAFG